MNKQIWKRVAEQYMRVTRGESWSGPSLDDLVAASEESARFRPYPSAKNAQEIGLHILSTLEVVEARLNGADKVLRPEEDWPSVEESWQETCARIMTAVEKLTRQIEALREDPDRPVLEGFSAFYVTLHGNLQHLYYHMGQMIQLIRMAERS